MKWLKRILLAVGVILTALILFLAGSILVDSLLGGGRIQAVSNTIIPATGASPELYAYVARPEGSGPFPTVIMIHEFYGLNATITGLADGLAQEGYLVVAPDAFRGSTTAWVPRAIFQVVTQDQAQVNQDLDAVYRWLETHPDVDPTRVGILGFCYGGRAALQYSLHNNRLAATVIFYGSPVTDPDVLTNLPGPVLGIFGGRDNSIPTQQVYDFKRALDEAGIPNDVLIYDDQPHAFITGIEGVRAGGAQGEAWRRMLAFWDEHLRGTVEVRQPGGLDYQAPLDWRYYLALAVAHLSGRH